MSNLRSPQVCFGSFALDLSARELRKAGRKVRLQEQPFQVLAILVEHPGEVVDREELRRKLWPNDTVVEFDHSINAAVRKLRVALGDSAEKPRYVETVGRLGYRFIARLKSSGVQPDDRPSVTPAFAETSLIGATVSHYRILELISDGGMGLVYKGEDIRLGRLVALKFLPIELAENAVALERFEREARSASALDHRNICPVYEFGEYRRQSFIVMPFLEGATLRDRLDAGLPGNELLDIAIQIAGGLSAAHRNGIIHRDIKPANIFVMASGEVKILDFGVAKLAGAAEGVSPGQAGVPEGITRAGATVGTASYMSPEQARGEAVDSRTDLFSFGLVLCEMSGGRRALPVRLERIIKRALQENREVRYQTALEMLADLRSAGVRARLPVVGGILTLLAITVAIFFWFTKTQQQVLRGQLEIRQRQLTANSSENTVSGGSISPDGTYLAYADLRGIHIKVIETGETRTVPQPDSLKGLQVNWGIATNWASDGSRFIANANVPGKPSSIWAVPALGGPPRKLRDDAYAWAVSRHGSWVAFTLKQAGGFYREMWRMRADGREAAKLYEGDENRGFFGADWSPDGKRLSYIGVHQVGGKTEESVDSRDLIGRPAAVAVPAAVRDWTWSPDGRIIYILAEASPLSGSCNFWELHLDARTGVPIGAPARLTNWAGFCMQDPTVTADGKRLAFRKAEPEGAVYVAGIQDGGRGFDAARRLTLNDGQNYPVGWTADSKAVIFKSDREGRWSVFKQGLDDDTAEPIATEAKYEWGASATVSSNGAWLLYVTGSAMDRLMRVSITGGSPELVMSARIYGKIACARPPANFCAVAEANEDRKQLIFTAFDPQKGRGSELTRFAIDPTTGNRYVWDLSPDGRRIAILKYGNGFIDVLGLGGQVSQKIAVKGWSSLLSVNWASEGTGIFTSSQKKNGSVLLRVSLDGDAQVLWEQNGSIAPWNRPFSGGDSTPFGVPSPDGRHLAIYGWTISSNMWMMENF